MLNILCIEIVDSLVLSCRAVLTIRIKSHFCVALLHRWAVSRHSQQITKCLKRATADHLVGMSERAISLRSFKKSWSIYLTGDVLWIDLFRLTSCEEDFSGVGPVVLRKNRESPPDLDLCFFDPTSLEPEE